MGEGVEFFKFSRKKGGGGGGGSDFSHKNRGIGKMGGVVFKKGGIFILTNPFKYYRSLSVWCVYVCVYVCVCICLFVYLHHFYQMFLCFTGRTQSCSVYSTDI